MARLRWLITLTSTFALILAGVSAFTAVATARWEATGAVGSSGGSGPEKITLERFRGGKILANARGFTIYAFTRDSRNKDRCVTIKGCKQSWPPVTTKGKPVAGPGVHQSLLRTISVPGVGRQVTYNGHPLYTYKFDGGPHQTYYVNFSAFGGRWPALNAKGQEVK